MNRRTVLRNAGITVGIGISGCTEALSGGCGPGKDEIADIADLPAASGTQNDTETNRDGATVVVVRGTIKSFASGHSIIDDTTGRAEIKTVGVDASTQLETGDCVERKGGVLPPTPELDVDVSIAAFPPDSDDESK
jgi:hypothetical protein